MLHKMGKKVRNFKQQERFKKIKTKAFLNKFANSQKIAKKNLKFKLNYSYNYKSICMGK